jgi:hypothetical protein
MKNPVLLWIAVAALAAGLIGAVAWRQFMARITDIRDENGNPTTLQAKFAKQRILKVHRAGFELQGVPLASKEQLGNALAALPKGTVIVLSLPAYSNEPQAKAEAAANLNVARQSVQEHGLVGGSAFTLEVLQ